MALIAVLCKLWQSLQTPNNRSNFDATSPTNRALALEPPRRKSSAIKQLDAVLLYADKSYEVEIKFANLVRICSDTQHIRAISRTLSL
jgi:hypothetical protein